MSTVSNMTVTFKLSRRVNLKNLAKKTGANKTKGTGFLSVTYRVYPTNSTALVYGSGKVVLLGSKSAEEALHAANVVCERLRCRKISLNELSIHNIVSVLNLKCNIDLKELFIHLHTKKKLPIFESELFPALNFKTHNGCKAIVFRSGKIIITGCRTLSQNISATKEIESVFLEFFLNC